MIGFILTMFGLTYTVGKVGVDHARSRASDIRYKNAVDKRDEFLKPMLASTEMIRNIEKNTDYSDVVDDLTYIFGQEYSSEFIHVLTRSTRKEFGNTKNYRNIVLDIRLSKIGKVQMSSVSGIRFCEEASYVDQLKRYFEVLSRNYEKNGIYLSTVVQDCVKPNPLKTMCFEELQLW